MRMGSRRGSVLDRVGERGRALATGDSGGRVIRSRWALGLDVFRSSRSVNANFARGVPASEWKEARP